MRTPAQERWLNFFNDLLYERLAPVYAAMDWLTLGAWWRLVRRAQAYVPPGGRVLEVGFGPGKLLAQLSQQADRAYGLDYAWGMCRVARVRLQEVGQPVRITRGSVYDLPYPHDTFDTVVSTFAFSGFREGRQAMQQIARVTAPGGRVVLVDIGLPTDGNRLGLALARLWQRVGDFLYDQPAMMAEAGLLVTNFQEFGPGRHIRAVVGQKAG